MFRFNRPNPNTVTIQQKRKFNSLQYKNNATNETQTQITRRLSSISPVAMNRVCSSNNALYLLPGRTYINPIATQLSSSQSPYLPAAECIKNDE